MGDRVMDDKERLKRILSAFDLPTGHFCVLGPELIRRAQVSGAEDAWSELLLTTAAWFNLYESTASGILWTPCLPDPQNMRKRCDLPRLEYELMNVTMRAHFAIPGQDASEVIENATMEDDIPIGLLKL